MLIPKRLDLFGQTIIIKKTKTLMKEENSVGMWFPQKNMIKLQLSTKEYIISKEAMEQTFLHELTHACLDMMGEEKLSENEKFVDVFANLIHQYIKQITK